MISTVTSVSPAGQRLTVDGLGRKTTTRSASVPARRKALRAAGISVEPNDRVKPVAPSGIDISTASELSNRRSTSSAVTGACRTSCACTIVESTARVSRNLNTSSPPGCEQIHYKPRLQCADELPDKGSGVTCRIAEVRGSVLALKCLRASLGRICCPPGTYRSHWLPRSPAGPWIYLIPGRNSCAQSGNRECIVAHVSSQS